MGVYIRKDSPFYWILLEGDRAVGRPTIREPTKVRHDAIGGALRKENKELARSRYHVRMNEVIRLPKPKRFIRLDDWINSLLPHRMPHPHDNDIDRRIAKQLTDDLGHLPLRDVDVRRVKTWIAMRRRRRRALVAEGAISRRRLAPLRREIAVLRAVLQAAVPEYLDKSPLDGIALPSK